VLLEAGALLHDTGHMISHRGHHKHGEYLALNADNRGLEAATAPSRRRWFAHTKVEPGITPPILP